MKTCDFCSETKNISFSNKYDAYVCPKHYYQLKRHGKILERTRFDKNEIIIYSDFAEICLYDKNQNIIEKAIIDLDDVEKCKEHRWYLKKSKNDKSYCQKRVGRLQLSHFIINFKKEDNLEVDHINGNSLDNRKNNLRIVTHQINMQNQKKLPTNNTSGYIGVCWNKANSCWDAQIKTNKKMIHLGSYKNKDDAIQARIAGEHKYFINLKK